MIYRVSRVGNYQNVNGVEASSPEGAVKQYVESVVRRTGERYFETVYVSYTEDEKDVFLEFKVRVNFVPIAWGPDVEITGKQYGPAR